MLITASAPCSWPLLIVWSLALSFSISMISSNDPFYYSYVYQANSLHHERFHEQTLKYRDITLTVPKVWCLLMKTMPGHFCEYPHDLNKNYNVGNVARLTTQAKDPIGAFPLTVKLIICTNSVPWSFLHLHCNAKSDLFNHLKLIYDLRRKKPPWQMYVVFISVAGDLYSSNHLP